MLQHTIPSDFRPQKRAVRIPKSILKDLRRDLKSPDEHTRWGALVSILDINPADPNARPLLIKAVQDPAPDVRQEAVEMLAHHAHPDAVRALKKALDDVERQVGDSAVRSLSSHGTLQAVRALSKRLNSEELEDALFAAESLAFRPSKANVQGLIRLAANADYERREIGFHGLATTRHPLALAHLHSLMTRPQGASDHVDDQSSILTELVNNLDVHGASAAPTIAIGLELPGHFVRKKANEGLHRLYRERTYTSANVHGRALRLFYPLFAKNKDNEILEQPHVVRAALNFARKPAELDRIERKRLARFTLAQLRAARPERAKN